MFYPSLFELTMYLRTLIEKIKTHYRRHRFDLSHPVLATCSGITLNGKPFQHTIFTCDLCGKTLALDMWQMTDLPPSMTRGCPGCKKDE